MWADLALVLAFVVLGGFFAAAELALVSLRPGQVGRLAAGDRRGRRVARLLEDPNRFLSAVQIGVTLAGMFSSAVGAVALSSPVSDALHRAGLTDAVADTLALVLVTVGVAYVSLVLGELAPKRLALQRAESIAVLAAGPLDTLARATRPVIWLLGRSTDLVVRLAGGSPTAGREVITEEELRDIVASNAEISQHERRLIGEVLDAGDRPLRAVMVHRVDVSALPVGLPVDQAVRRTADRPFSRYPVVDGGLDDVVGFVHLRDLLTSDRTVDGRSVLVGELARPVLRMPDSRRVLPALAEMRRRRAHLAIVADEYGGSAGIVTLEDLIEELVGDITDEFDEHATDPDDAADHGGGEPLPGDEDDDPAPDRDGSGRPRPRRPPRLPLDDVPAQLRLDEFAERTGVHLPPGPYETAAGWLMHRLGRIPRVGDVAETEASRPDDPPARLDRQEAGDLPRPAAVLLRVTAIRGHRVERLRLEPAGESAPEPVEAPVGQPAGQEAIGPAGQGVSGPVGQGVSGSDRVVGGARPAQAG